MRAIYIIAILLLIAFANSGIALAQSNLVNDLQYELVPYVDSKNPTDTLLDYYCVITLADENATPNLYVKVGTLKDTANRFDNIVAVTAQSVSGTTVKGALAGINNSKNGNKVKIYIGRFHFELMYFEVTAKDKQETVLGTKVKDMRNE